MRRVVVVVRELRPFPEKCKLHAKKVKFGAYFSVL